MRAFSSDSDVSRFLVDHASACLTQTEGKTPTPDDNVIVDGTPVDIEVCVCVCVCVCKHVLSIRERPPSGLL